MIEPYYTISGHACSPCFEILTVALTNGLYNLRVAWAVDALASTVDGSSPGGKLLVGAAWRSSPTPEKACPVGWMVVLEGGGRERGWLCAGWLVDEEERRGGGRG